MNISLEILLILFWGEKNKYNIDFKNMNSERMQYFHLQCPIIVAASVMHFVYLVEITIKLTDDHVTNIHIKGTVENNIRTFDIRNVML